VYLFVDANPIQLTATFHYYQTQQPIHVATRIRLEKNTFVRVIAESQDGHYFMHKVAIKTPGGGCGGGTSSDEAKLRAEAGKMKLVFNHHQDANTTQLNSTEDSSFSHRIRFNIKHPMRTGFERTTQGYYAKSYHIKRLDFSSASMPILSIDVGVGISADPFFDFAVSNTLEKSVQVKALDNEAKMYEQSF
jgi:sulfur-oxidizing protein SoxY